MTKWVYSFGAGHNEGRADMRDLLGGKGANLAEMATLGLPVPPGFTITTEVCTAFYDNDRKYPGRARRRGRARRCAASSRRSGQRFGDAEQAAAGLGALRRPRLDARHDGHRAQPRPQRRDRRRPGRRVRTTALRLGQLPPLRPDVRRGRARRRRTTASRRSSSRPSSSRGVTEDTELAAEDWQRVVDGFKDIVRGRDRQAVPAGPAAAALGRDRRGVRLLDEPARR